MKPTRVLLGLILVLAAFFWRFRADQQSSDTVTDETVSQGASDHPTFEREALDQSRNLAPLRGHLEFLRAQAEREHAFTVRNIERAIDSANLDSEKFGRNGDFLREKYRLRFEDWQLMDAQKDRIISIIEQYSIDSIQEVIRSDVSWLDEVGHYSNRENRLAHTRKLVESLNRLRSATLDHLTAIVSREQAEELLASKPDHAQK
jgi:hypothetical protein